MVFPYCFAGILAKDKERARTRLRALAKALLKLEFHVKDLSEKHKAKQLYQDGCGHVRLDSREGNPL